PAGEVIAAAGLAASPSHSTTARPLPEARAAQDEASAAAFYPFEGGGFAAVGMETSASHPTTARCRPDACAAQDGAAAAFYPFEGGGLAAVGLGTSASHPTTARRRPGACAAQDAEAAAFYPFEGPGSLASRPPARHPPEAHAAPGPSAAAAALQQPFEGGGRWGAAAGEARLGAAAAAAPSCGVGASAGGCGSARWGVGEQVAGGGGASAIAELREKQAALRCALDTEGALLRRELDALHGRLLEELKAVEESVLGLGRELVSQTELQNELQEEQRQLRQRQQEMQESWKMSELLGAQLAAPEHGGGARSSSPPCHGSRHSATEDFSGPLASLGAEQVRLRRLQEEMQQAWCGADAVAAQRLRALEDASSKASEWLGRLDSLAAEQVQLRRLQEEMQQAWSAADAVAAQRLLALEEASSTASERLGRLDSLAAEQVRLRRLQEEMQQAWSAADAVAAQRLLALEEAGSTASERLGRLEEASLGQGEARAALQSQLDHLGRSVVGFSEDLQRAAFDPHASLAALRADVAAQARRLDRLVSTMDAQVTNPPPYASLSASGASRNPDTAASVATVPSASQPAAALLRARPRLLPPDASRIILAFRAWAQACPLGGQLALESAERGLGRLWLELREQGSELRGVTAELEGLRGGHARCSSELQALHGTVREQGSELRGATAELEGLRGGHARCASELAVLRKKADAAQEELRQLQGLREVEEAAEELRGTVASLQVLQAEHSKLAAAWSGVEERVCELSERNQGRREADDRMRAELSELARSHGELRLAQEHSKLELRRAVEESTADCASRVRELSERDQGRRDADDKVRAELSELARSHGELRLAQGRAELELRRSVEVSAAECASRVRELSERDQGRRDADDRVRAELSELARSHGELRLAQGRAELELRRAVEESGAECASRAELAQAQLGGAATAEGLEELSRRVSEVVLELQDQRSSLGAAPAVGLEELSRLVSVVALELQDQRSSLENLRQTLCEVAAESSSARLGAARPSASAQAATEAAAAARRHAGAETLGEGSGGPTGAPASPQWELVPASPKGAAAEPCASPPPRAALAAGARARAAPSGGGCAEERRRAPSGGAEGNLGRELREMGAQLSGELAEQREVLAAQLAGAQRRASEELGALRGQLAEAVGDGAELRRQVEFLGARLDAGEQNSSRGLALLQAAIEGLRADDQLAERRRAAAEPGLLQAAIEGLRADQLAERRRAPPAEPGAAPRGGGGSAGWPGAAAP
ncbi:unnamed protein product, partial [Prorocentrum cordatum]